MDAPASGHTPAPWRDTVGLVAAILRVCNSHTINFDASPANSVRAIVGICLRFIDKERLLQEAAPGTFLDWAMVSQAGPGANALGDTPTWIALFQHVSFPSLELQDMALRKLYPPLWCVLNSLRESRAYDHGPKLQQRAPHEASDNLCFSDACKLCIAVNLEGVACRNVVDRYISSRLSR